MKLRRVVRDSERGQSLVELAVALVLLLILLAGIIDLGRALVYSTALRDASQEGAVYGALNPPYYDPSLDPVSACANIEKRARSALPGPDEPGVVVQVYFGPGSGTPCTAAAPAQACSGQPVRVVVLDDFGLSMPLLGTLIGRESFTLEASVNGTVLRPPCT